MYVGFKSTATSQTTISAETPFATLCRVWPNLPSLALHINDYMMEKMTPSSLATVTAPTSDSDLSLSIINSRQNIKDNCLNSPPIYSYTWFHKMNCSRKRSCVQCRRQTWSAGRTGTAHIFCITSSRLYHPNSAIKLVFDTKCHLKQQTRPHLWLQPVRDLTSTTSFQCHSNQHLSRRCNF